MNSDHKDHKIGDLVLYKDIIDGSICLGIIRKLNQGLDEKCYLIQWSTQPNDLMQHSTESSKTISDMKLNLKEFMNERSQSR